MELIVNQVTMRFQENCALDHVSFSLKPGIHVLMGENGAGKSTLLRILSGVQRPQGGTVALENGALSGHGLRPAADLPSFPRTLRSSDEEYRNLLGYLPQEFGYYPEFSGRAFLLYLASLKGLTKKQALQRTNTLLTLFSLEDAADKKIRTYSNGMKQRLGIAQTLLNNPRLLIMDEPIAGLDPVEQLNFHRLIKKLGTSRIVLLSAHTAADVEALADTVLFMKSGRLIFHGKLCEQSESLETLFLKYARPVKEEMLP